MGFSALCSSYCLLPHYLEWCSRSIPTTCRTDKWARMEWEWEWDQVSEYSSSPNLLLFENYNSHERRTFYCSGIRYGRPDGIRWLRHATTWNRNELCGWYADLLSTRTRRGLIEEEDAVLLFVHYSWQQLTINMDQLIAKPWSHLSMDGYIHRGSRILHGCCWCSSCHNHQ